MSDRSMPPGLQRADGRLAGAVHHVRLRMANRYDVVSLTGSIKAASEELDNRAPAPAPNPIDDRCFEGAGRIMLDLRRVISYIEIISISYIDRKWRREYAVADVLKSMTLRGMDARLAAKLREVAKREGKSMNRTALEALRQQFGLDKPRRFTEVHSDLDHLFGRWDEDEFARIQGKIDSERRIDPELWR